MNKNRNKILILSIILITITILFGCNTDAAPAPVADYPKLTYISPDAATALNKSVTLSVEANVSDGGSLSYQWYKASDKLEEGTKITINVDSENVSDEEARNKSGKTSTYSPDVSSAGTFYYYCRITNSIEGSANSIVSPRISVTVKDSVFAEEPVILSKPVSITSRMGEDFELSLLAYSVDGGELSYQWYYSSSADGTAEPLNGATEKTYKEKISEKTQL